MAKQIQYVSQNVTTFRQKAILLAKKKDIKITFAAFLDMLQKSSKGDRYEIVRERNYFCFC